MHNKNTGHRRSKAGCLSNAPNPVNVEQKQLEELTQYDLIRKQNCKTSNFYTGEAYPSIKPPVSRCDPKKTAEWLSDALEANGCARLFDMKQDDLMTVWSSSPNKESLSCYGAGTLIHTPEAVHFNQVLAKSLQLANESGKPAPSKNKAKPQNSPIEPDGSYVLNRQCLQSQLEKMPTVKRKLNPLDAINWLTCSAPQQDIECPFCDTAAEGAVSLRTALDMEGTVKRRAKQRIRRKHHYCQDTCNIPTNKCTEYEWQMYKQNPRTYEEAFKLWHEEKEALEIEPEPKNYEELYSRLVTCFERDPNQSKDWCATFEACCKKEDDPKPQGCGEYEPKGAGDKRDGKFGGGGAVGGGADGGRGGSVGGPGDGKKGSGINGSHSPSKSRRPGDGNVKTSESEDGEKKVSDRRDGRDKDRSKEGDAGREGGDAGKGKRDGKDDQARKQDEKDRDRSKDGKKDGKDVADGKGDGKDKDRADDGADKKKTAKKDDNRPHGESQGSEGGKGDSKDKAKDGKDKDGTSKDGESKDKDQKAKDAKEEAGKPLQNKDKFKQFGDDYDGKEKPSDKKDKKKDKKKEKEAEKDDRLKPLGSLTSFGDGDDRTYPINKDTNLESGDERVESDTALEVVSLDGMDDERRKLRIRDRKGKTPAKTPDGETEKTPEQTKPQKSKKKKTHGPKQKVERAPEIKRDCPCEICRFMKRRCREPDSPLIRDMKRQEKNRQLRDYYNQMCRREYVKHCPEPYPCPQHKCDPVACDNSFCCNPKIAEHFDRVAAMQNLQKILRKRKRCGDSKVNLILDRLKERLCDQLVDSISLGKKKA